MSIYEIIVRPGEGGYPSTGWHRSQMPGPQSPPGQVQCGHSKIWVSGSYGHFLMSVLKSSIWSRGISPHPVFGLAACLCSYYLQRMTQESCQEPELWRSPGCFFQPPLPSLAGVRRRSVQTPMPAGLVKAAELRWLQSSCGCGHSRGWVSSSPSHCSASGRFCFTVFRHS